MGSWLGRFRRQQTTEEILESIDKDIAKLQRFRRKNQELQKNFVASLFLYSIVFSIFGAVIVYFVYLPATWGERFLYIVLPIFGFSCLIYGLRKLLHWYFVKRIADNDIALGELREKRKLILEEVMDKETYNKAKAILERFDPARFKQLEKPPATPSSQVIKPATVTPSSALRQRVSGSRLATPSPGSPRIWTSSLPVTPRRPQPLQTPATGRMIMSSQNGRFPAGYGQPPGPPLPRPVLPKERGTVDKLVEYLVGDGPQNRYALICRQCHCHNGMALKEEFEYLSFRCCYCYTMNPARKQRPHAPKLEFPAARLQQQQLQRPETPGSTLKRQSESEEEEDDEEEESEDNTADLEEPDIKKVVENEKTVKTSLTEAEEVIVDVKLPPESEIVSVEVVHKAENTQPSSEIMAEKTVHILDQATDKPGKDLDVVEESSPLTASRQDTDLLQEEPTDEENK